MNELQSNHLTVAIEVDPGDKSAKRKKPPISIERLLTMCGGLIVRNDETDVTYVGLAHFSVKEYLHSRYTNPKDAIFKVPERKANQELAQVCLTYLAFDDFKTGPVNEYADFQQRSKDYPLLQYAAKQTTYHFRRGQPPLSGRWFEVLFRFTTRKARVNKHLKAWRQARDGFGYHEPFMISENLEATHLIFAAESGLTSVVISLLAAGADVNYNGFYGTALLAACSEGHSDTVDELLKAGADMQMQNDELGTPLVAASASGHVDIARTLLAKGAEINQVAGFHGTAIEAAAYRGNEELVRILLDTGADVNLVAGRYGTPLLAASYKGREHIVRSLVNKGADINIEGTRYGSALRAASEEGHDNVVQYLLDHGAHLNAIGGEYGTALQAASRSGDESVVKLLLKSGASVDAVGGFYGCALQAASRTDINVVRALLLAGADVNQDCGQYHTALAAATTFGKADIVQLLLDSGATGASEALQIAWVEDKQEVAEVLEKWIKSADRAQL